MDNELTMIFTALSENEAFARSAVAAFAVGLNPTIEEVNDIKTAVSEAVTNSIVHGYNGKEGQVTLKVRLSGRTIHIAVVDSGVGIEDIERARQPFYSTKADEERSGMGFTVMEAVMDSLRVYPTEGGGVTVEMEKNIGERHASAGRDAKTD